MNKKVTSKKVKSKKAEEVALSTEVVEPEKAYLTREECSEIELNLEYQKNMILQIDKLILERKLLDKDVEIIKGRQTSLGFQISSLKDKTSILKVKNRTLVADIQKRLSLPEVKFGFNPETLEVILDDK